MVTFVILGLVATGVVSLAMRAFVDTATIAERRDVFADGRIVLDRLSKQLRQAESVDQAAGPASVDRDSSDRDGTPTVVVGRGVGSAPPYRLEESRNGGTSFTTVASSLASPDVFTYTTHAGVLDQVTVRLELRTRTSTVPLTTDVFLRNATD